MYVASQRYRSQTDTYMPKQTYAHRTLDLDDYESLTRLNFARLAASQGDSLRALLEQNTAIHFRNLEQSVLARFDTILLSNENDRRAIAANYGCSHFRLLPNCIETRPGLSGAPYLTSLLTLLFVGTIDYYPNADAAIYFCLSVLLLLRRQLSPLPFRVLIVGARPTKEVRCFGAHPEVHVTGEVEDLAPFYRVADVVIAPLRVGGGIWVKILEAFAYAKAVVTTGPGSDRLNVRHGAEIFVANTPLQFAEYCKRLLVTPQLRETTGRRAREWLVSHHSIGELLSTCCRPILALNRFRTRTNRAFHLRILPASRPCESPCLSFVPELPSIPAASAGCE